MKDGEFVLRAILTLLFADAAGAIVAWLCRGLPLVAHVPALPVLVPAFGYSFVFALTTIIADAFSWRRRRRPRGRKHRASYRVNARIDQALPPTTWVFKEPWEWVRLIRRSVLALIATLVACVATLPLGKLFYWLPLMLSTGIVYAYCLFSAALVLQAHLEYLRSFVRLRIDAAGLEISRALTLESGRASPGTVARLRTIGGLVLVPYETGLWLSRPLRETKNGRYLVLRPIALARVVIDQIRQVKNLES